MGWLSVAGQEALSSRTDTRLILFQEDRQKYTAAINITLILSERAPPKASHKPSMGSSQHNRHS